MPPSMNLTEGAREVNSAEMERAVEGAMALRSR